MNQYKQNYNQRKNPIQKKTLSHSSKKSLFKNDSIDSDSLEINQTEPKKKHIPEEDPKLKKLSEKTPELSNA